MVPAAKSPWALTRTLCRSLRIPNYKESFRALQFTKKSFVAILVVHEIENKRKFFRFDILPSLKYFFRKMHFQSVFPPLQKYCFNCCQRVLRCFRFFLIISGWFFFKDKIQNKHINETHFTIRYKRFIHFQVFDDIHEWN